MSDKMEWYFAKGLSKRGPFTHLQMQEMILRGEVHAADLVWRTGSAEWLPASSVFPEFTPPPLENQIKGEPRDVPVLDAANLSFPDERVVTRGGYFSRHWRGQLSLGVSYWINGFLANIAVSLGVLAVAALFSSVKGNYVPAGYWVAVCAFITVVFVWQTGGVWRAANAHTRRTGRRFWSTAAKVAVVLGALKFATEIVSIGIPAIGDAIKHGNWLARNAHWEINLLRDGTEIELQGGIGYGIASDVERFLTSAPSVKLVHLNLELGGLVEEAEKLNSIIRARHLSTYVASQCASACTIAFIAGNERYLRRGARLGFHAYKIPGVSPAHLDATPWKATFSAAGVSKAFTEKVFATPSESMWYPDEQELIQNSVVTAIVTGDEFGLSGFRREGAAANARQTLLKVRLYRAISSKEPELFESIVSQVSAGLAAGQAVDDLRPIMSKNLQPLLTKYLPYADDESVKSFAVHIASVASVLRGAPAVCMGYFGRGDASATASAIRLYPESLRARELEVIAGILDSADASRKQPSKAAKEKVLTSAIESARRALGNRATELDELSKANPDPAGWCEGMFAIYQAVGQLPASQARVGTLALVE